MKTKPLPSQEYLLATLRYEPESGLLYWRERVDARPQWNGHYAGKVAGNEDRGRIYVSLKPGGLFAAHRIIWKMLHNIEPPEVDHKDLDGTNNREANLRAATRPENMRNRRGRAVSGYKGVSLHKSGLWRARLHVNGTDICRYFDKPEAAAKAYAQMAAEYHGEFARAA